MDIKRLRYFSVLAETANFTKAAEKLGIAQSALSISMQKMEDQLGLKLINRQEKQFNLTSEGEVVLAHALRIIEDVSEAKKEIKELKGLKSGSINFGVSAMLGSYLLPEALARFKQQYPGIQMNIIEAGTQSLLKMLQNNTLDIALIRTDNKPDQVRYTTLLTEEIVALLPEEHHLAQQESITMDLFCQQPLVLFREGYFLRDVISKHVKKHKLNIDLQFETNLIELLKKMVTKEVGISTCLPCVLDGSEPLVTRSFSPPITLSLGIGWKSNHYLSKASRAFIDFMHQEIGKV